jgi:hypothetical protein
MRNYSSFEKRKNQKYLEHRALVCKCERNLFYYYFKNVCVLPLVSKYSGPTVIKLLSILKRISDSENGGAENFLNHCILESENALKIANNLGTPQNTQKRILKSFMTVGPDRKSF